MQGRAHYYEGYSMAQVTLPVRVFKRLGINNLIVTNAAGAVNPDFEPGNLMLITDHLNLVGMAGANPLHGPNLDELGPRFPDMSQAYDRQLLELARRAGRQAELALREGVYCGLSGPSFETPADLRFLRAAGVDAVGMSTVPEAIAARHMGIRVVGVSCLTNMAAGVLDQKLDHREVLETGERVKLQLLEVLATIVEAAAARP